MNGLEDGMKGPFAADCFHGTFWEIMHSSYSLAVKRNHDHLVGSRQAWHCSYI